MPGRPCSDCLWPGVFGSPWLTRQPTRQRTTGQRDCGSLLAGLHLRRHQSDLVDAHTFGDIDNLSDVLELEVGIAFDEDYALGARFENLLQTRPEPGFIRRLLIDHQ